MRVVDLDLLPFTVSTGNVPAIFGREIDTVRALMLRMASTLGLLPTVNAVDRLPRYPSATTLTDVLDMAPSTRHPLRGFVSASQHGVPPSFVKEN